MPAIPAVVRACRGGEQCLSYVEASLFISVVGLTAALLAPTGSAHERRGPVVTPLATFGDGTYTTGSTIGPELPALYVTDGSAGERPPASIAAPVAPARTQTGLPTKAFATDIGGPVDVVFAGRTAFVLVTLVSGQVIGGDPFGDPEAKNGIYRLRRDGTFTLVADIGQWSIDNPPEPAIFIDTGVQYAMESYRGGSPVTDGHHNRVLWVVPRRADPPRLAAFENVVPTGLEVTKRRVLITQLGPIPHHAGERQGPGAAAIRCHRDRQWGEHARRRRARAEWQAVRPLAGSVGRGGGGHTGDRTRVGC